MRGISDLYLRECTAVGARVNSAVLAIFAAADKADVVPTTWDFSGNHIGDLGVQAIARVVATICQLQRLILTGCCFEEPAVGALCEGLKNHPHVHHVDLRGTALYATSGRHIIGLLKHNQRIYECLVDTSEMPPRIAQAFDVILARNVGICCPQPPPAVEPRPETSKRLEELLAELHEPQPDALMRAIRERLVHCWYVRLGPFAVQVLRDRGVSSETVEYLLGIEREYCAVPPGEPLETSAYPTEAFPLRSPFDRIRREVDCIASQLSIPDSPLSVVALLRGPTLRLRSETCVRLLAEMDTAAAPASPEAIQALMDALVPLRELIAGTSLAGLEAATREAPEQTAVVARRLAAADAVLQEQVSHVADTLFVRRRELSLLCDEMRYFTVNQPAFMEAVRDRACFVALSPSAAPQDSPLKASADLYDAFDDATHSARSALLRRLRAVLGGDGAAFVDACERARASARTVKEAFPAWAPHASLIEAHASCPPPRDRNAAAAEPLSTPAAPAAVHVPAPRPARIEHALRPPPRPEQWGDTMDVFGAIEDRADAYRWARACTASQRYTALLA